MKATVTADKTLDIRHEEGDELGWEVIERTTESMFTRTLAAAKTQALARAILTKLAEVHLSPRTVTITMTEYEAKSLCAVDNNKTARDMRTAIRGAFRDGWGEA